MATTKAPRKKKEQIKRPDLKIGIKDFGPIAEGEIELKPLTVFIGPNNSGKSYAAMLIHSIFQTYNVISHREGSFSIKEGLSYGIRNSKVIKQVITDLKERLNELKTGEDLHISKDVLTKLTNESLKELNTNRLSKALSRLYSCKLSDLVMVEKESFILNINFCSFSTSLLYRQEKLDIVELPSLKQKSNIRVKLEKSGYVIEENEKPMILSFVKDKKKIPHNIVESLIDIYVSSLIGNLTMPCHYLPAARSGIIQGHKALTASIARNAPYLAIERKQWISGFSGVVWDFISSIIELPRKRGPLNRIANMLENELMKGNIVIRTRESNQYPDIKYKFHGIEIPLHRASSTISELTPILIYLKYVVTPGSILIIEEPEAHLHPANIRILAKYLVRLVRKGVNVLITTHSEYLLEQLNNFFLLSKIDPNDRKERYNHDEDDYIKHDELGIYEFQYDENVGGYKIKKAEISEENGIEQEEFTKILESLFDETSKLRGDLEEWEEQDCETL